MKDTIQYEKAKKKMNLLKEHIFGLLEYNSIADYNNTKSFNLTINYSYDQYNNCYSYDINIYRGRSFPTKTFSTHIQYKDKLNDLILDLVTSLFLSNDFCYSSFYNDNSEKHNKFTIRLNNDIAVEFPILDQEDKLFYENLNKNNNNLIKLKQEKNNISITSELKDNVQKEKANKIIDNIDRIFNSIIDINNINNYENKKPFKMQLYSKKLDDCTSFVFNIIRGNLNPEIITTYTLSIKDIAYIYDKLYDLILKYCNKEEFIYSSLMNDGFINNFKLHFNNMIEIEFIYGNKNEDEKYFYNNMFEISEKKVMTNNTKILNLEKNI